MPRLHCVLRKLQQAVEFIIPISFCLLLGTVPASYASEVETGATPSTIETVQFASKALDAQRTFNILLPTDYATSTKRYPTLYLLHGYGDTHTAWSLMTNLTGYAAKLDLIIVMPDAGKSFYVNSVSDPKARFEDFIVKDLIAYVDSHYRTIPLPRCRAIAGLSMGGYGATFLGLKHYKDFAAIGSFSGAVGFAHFVQADEAKMTKEDRDREKRVLSLCGPMGSPERSACDPYTLLEKIPVTDVPALFIACGGQDFLLAQNREWVDFLSKKKISYDYREVSPRIHSWEFWDEQIQEYFGFLKGLKGFSNLERTHAPMPAR
jgi:putative tributyrin esterase